MGFLKGSYGFIGKLGGKRFVIAFGALLGIALSGTLGLDEAQINSYAGWAAGFIFADNVVSKLTGGATSAESFSEKDAT